MKHSRHRSRETLTPRPFWKRTEFYVFIAVVALVVLLGVLFYENQWLNGGGQSNGDPVVAENVRKARDKVNQGISLNLQKELDLAAQCFKEALELAPQELEPHYYLMLYHEEKSKLSDQDGDSKNMLFHAMMSGFHARQLLGELDKLRGEDRGFVAEAIYNESKGRMLLGERENCLAALKLAIESGFSDRAGIDAEPIFDPLRETPEFQELLKLIR